MNAERRSATAARKQASVERGARARLETGRPHPLGTTWDGGGVNFALFSAFANTLNLPLPRVSSFGYHIKYRMIGYKVMSTSFKSAPSKFTS